MITYAELKKHNKKDDCWVLIHGNVYNVTKFLNEHPGGAKVILKESGKDATAAFDMIHPLDIIENHLPSNFNLGPIDSTTLPAVIKKEVVITKRPPIDSVLNLFDMELIAKKVLTKEAWAYYSSGAEDELTMRENHLAFHRIMFKPRVMRNVKVIDLTHRMFGKLVNLPIYITATALGKLGHPEGEVVLTKAAGTKNIIQMMPTLASCSVAEMMDNALPGQEQWFQLYVNQDRVAVKKLLEKVESRGVRVLFVTVDAPSLGKREKDMRVKFVDDAPDESKHTELNRTQGAARAISTFIDPSLCWDDVSWFKANTKMKIVLKGIQCGEDAVLAAQHGCDGIVVSNHGGRQLDTCRSGIEVLPECIAALKEAGLRDKLQVFMDGGVRRGGDIFKALALGADAVGLGRPFLYGMASYGQQGVEKVIDILAEELTMTMRMCGVTNIKDIGPEYVLANNLNSHIGVAPKGYGFSNAYERMETIDSKL